MFDLDTFNQIHAEEKQYQEWERREKNRILAIPNVQRKQEQWDNLYPKLELDGLTEEQLNQPY